MDEQVVPSFGPPTATATVAAVAAVAPNNPTASKLKRAAVTAAPNNPAASKLKRTTSVATALNTLAPPPPSSPSAPPPAVTTSAVTAANESAQATPPPEYPGKLRFQTPLRVGTWPEAWQSARQLGAHLCVARERALPLAALIRSAVADAVVRFVGPQLPRATVEKWLCLLCEYLELDADERVLLVCLLRRYVKAGGRFVGCGDWARPQRWECVVAVACYMAVLLTEEFPGATAVDLRELLGPNFRFGQEQVAFLKIVDWRVSIEAETFEHVRDTLEAVLDENPEAASAVRDWFCAEELSSDVASGITTDTAPPPPQQPVPPTKHHVPHSEHTAHDQQQQHVLSVAAAAAAAAAATIVPKPVAPVLHTALPPVMSAPAVPLAVPVVAAKKRPYAAIAPADDSIVPRVVIPRIAHPVAQPHPIAHPHAHPHPHAHAHAHQHVFHAVPSAFYPHWMHW